MKNKHYTDIYEISKSWTQGKEVDLPAIQRGYVWRPSQIEYLWDSLLRGYPIGSFIFSSPNAQGKFQLLDGQQRATSIALGFNAKSFKADSDNISIYIDLRKSKDESRAFIFRVITKSHPWGYALVDNKDALKSQQIRKAHEIFKLEKGKKHFETSLDSFWPCDAGIPLPLHFILEAAESGSEGKQKLIERIKTWSQGKSTFTLDEKSFQTKISESILSSQGEDYYSIDELYEKFLILKEAQFPKLYLNLDLQKTQEDDIENLFVRLNAKGSPLSLEELNYSVLKSNISVEAQERIESSCEDLISPARFISIAFRLYQHSKGDKPYDLNVKAKVFQKFISQEQDNQFENFMVTMIIPELLKFKDRFQFSESFESGLPLYSLRAICHSSPEILFLYMYRAVIRKDCLLMENSVNKKKVLGFITLLAWFGRSRKNQEKIMTSLLKEYGDDDFLAFWSQRSISKLLKPLENGEVLLSHLYSARDLHQKVNISGNKFSSTLNEMESEFCSHVLFQKSLLIYAQRVYFDREFDPKLFSLEDTNVPFDWDHLSPQSLLSRSTSKDLKHWYESIGNYRVLSYSQNRSRQDAPLLEGLDDEIANNDFCIDSEEWRKHTFSKSDLSSNVESQWIVTALIIKRSFSIYEHWYNELFIDELIPHETIGFDKAC